MEWCDKRIETTPLQRTPAEDHRPLSPLPRRAGVWYTFLMIS
jgi:hypothetical protein